MTAQSLVLLALKASIVLSVFAIGLASRVEDTLFLLRRPSAAPALGAGDQRRHAARRGGDGVGLRSAGGGGGGAGGARGVAGSASLAQEADQGARRAILCDRAPGRRSRWSPSCSCPIAVELLGLAFQMPVHMSPWPIAKLVFATVLAPLLAGIFVRRIAPGIAARFARPIGSDRQHRAGALRSRRARDRVAGDRHPWSEPARLWAVAAFVAHRPRRRTLARRPRPERPHRARARHRLPAPRRRVGDQLGELSRNTRTVLPAFLLYLLGAAVLAIPYVMWRKRDELDGPIARTACLRPRLKARGKRVAREQKGRPKPPFRKPD